MTNKIEKVIGEIEKLKVKIVDYQTRLRDLERLKIEMENAEIVSLVRGMDVAPEKLRAFLDVYKKENEVANAPIRKEKSEDEK